MKTWTPSYELDGVVDVETYEFDLSLNFIDALLMSVRLDTMRKIADRLPLVESVLGAMLSGLPDQPVPPERYSVPLVTVHRGDLTTPACVGLCVAYSLVTRVPDSEKSS